MLQCGHLCNRDLQLVSLVSSAFVSVITCIEVSNVHRNCDMSWLLDTYPGIRDDPTSGEGSLEYGLPPLLRTPPDPEELWTIPTMHWAIYPLTLPRGTDTEWSAHGMMNPKLNLGSFSCPFYALCLYAIQDVAQI